MKEDIREVAQYVLLTLESYLEHGRENDLKEIQKMFEKDVIKLRIVGNPKKDSVEAKKMKLLNT